MNFFDLPHVFVVFKPGSGGNFVAGLCNKVLNQQLDPITISGSGSSHTLVAKKAAGIDFPAFTTETLQHSLFSSDSERIEFYIENIKKHYSDVSVPIVTWSHDFTNIPIYRKYFKNSKILVITVSSETERCTAIIMHLLKTILDPHAAVPLVESEWKKIVTDWHRHCRTILEKALPTLTASYIDEIMSNRFNPDHKDILEFISIKRAMYGYRVTGLFDENSTDKIGIYNNVLYKSTDPQSYFRVGPKLETFIDAGCVTLPYSYLADDQHSLLTTAISAVLDRELSHTEQEFVKTEFSKYRAAQDQLLLTDPKKYYYVLKSIVYKKYYSTENST